MQEQLTDILANAWSRLVSATAMRSMLEGQVDSTQRASNFERPACEEVDDTSLPFRLWHKVGDDDSQSDGIEETESVGLAGRPLAKNWFAGKRR